MYLKYLLSKYLHVSALLHVCCCFHLRRLDQLHASTHMYVYVRIFCMCMYMMYMHVLCSYMHVFPGMRPSDTGTDVTSLIHSLLGLQAAGHTQGTPGHLGIHFFLPSQLCRPYFAHAPPFHGTRPGPLKRPSGLTQGSPIHDSRTKI